MERVVELPRKAVLVGHPNVGKSEVFSRMTGRYVSVSNFPGTTVEIFRGRTRVDGTLFEVADTPGIHSLFSHSEEERVTLQLLRRERPDLLIQVAEAKNLRRTLLLTAQLSQLNIPMILDLNMSDESASKGVHVNCRKLSRRLGIPVVETIATTGQGIKQVCRAFGEARPCLINGAQPIEWVEDLLDLVRREHPPGLAAAPKNTMALLSLLAAGVLVHLYSTVGGWLGRATPRAWMEEELLGWAAPGAGGPVAGHAPGGASVRPLFHSVSRDAHSGGVHA